MKKILQQNKILLYAIVFALIFCTVFFTVQLSERVAFAVDVKYSNVLDDLKVDTTFNANNYPSKSDDYSISLIQIAEGKNNDVYAYVYQPSGKTKDYKASSINVSTTINDAISYFNYKLEFCNSYGVFYKYRIVDLPVTQDNVRYYSISSIYRPFDSSVDDKTSGDNTVTEVPFAVNRQYAFGIINGKPYVECVDIETIVVTDKFVGFVRYENGFNLYKSACDSHFVAFNTNKPMDKLLEADVYYTKQSYNWTNVAFSGTTETFGDPVDSYAYLKYTDKVEHTGNGLFAGTYKWDRIQTIDDFISGENTEQVFTGAILSVKVSSKLTESTLAELKGKKWVLRFAETDYSLNGHTGYTGESFTIVGNVTILRLKFETNGVVYNLGVIDNKQTGSSNPSNETDYDVEVKDEYKWLVALLLFLLLIVICAPILPYVIEVIVKIISLPFKAMKRISTSIKKSKVTRSINDNQPVSPKDKKYKYRR